MFKIFKFENFKNLKNSKKEVGLCLFRSIFSANVLKSNKSNFNKGPVYFYKLRQKKKILNLKNNKFFNKKLKKPLYRVFKNKKTVAVRLFKGALRDFFINSQFSKRYSLKNYNKKLFFNSIVYKKNTYYVNKYKSSFFYKKSIEDKHNLYRSVKTNKNNYNKLFFFIFKNVVLSKKFCVLLRSFELGLISPKFSNFNYLSFNKKIVLKKPYRGLLKIVPSRQINKFKYLLFNSVKSSNFIQNNKSSNYLLNVRLLDKRILKISFLRTSILYFFKYFFFFLKNFNKFFHRNSRFLGYSESKQFFIAINFIASRTFKVVFEHLLNFNNSNLPFISAKHFVWIIDNSNNFFKKSNSNFFRYYALRSNILFSSFFFGNFKNKVKNFYSNSEFIDFYSQSRFNFLYPVLKFRKLFYVASKNKFFTKYFRSYNFKLLRAKRQTLDYTILFNENSPYYLSYGSKKNVISARLKVWQPRLKKLVSLSTNVYIEPINNLLFSFVDYGSSKFKKFKSILKNKHSSLKYLLRITYSIIVKRFFNIMEPAISSGFATAFRRKYVNFKTQILSTLLKLILRSTTKEFFDFTSDFVNRLKFLGLWRFSNLEPGMLKPNSTSNYHKQKDFFLSQETGLSTSDSEQFPGKNNFVKYTHLSYLDWLHTVWNVPFLITKGEMFILSDVRTKKLFLGLDRIPKRALIYNNLEKNNFSTYYSCNALGLCKLLTFYCSLLNSENDFSKILINLFGKAKQIETINNLVCAYKKNFLSFNKTFQFNLLFNRGLPQSFGFSAKLLKTWINLTNKYGSNIANFLFFTALKITFSKNLSKFKFFNLKFKTLFNNEVFYKLASNKKKINYFWSTLSFVCQKFRNDLFYCLKIPFSLILFSCSSNFKPFFIINKDDKTLETVRRFVNTLPSRRNYLKLSMSSKNKQKFFSNRFVDDYYFKLSKIRPSEKCFNFNSNIIKYSNKTKFFFYNFAAVLTFRYFNNKYSLKPSSVKKLKILSILNSNSATNAIDYNNSKKLLATIFNKKKDDLLFKELYNIYYHKNVVTRRLKFKLLSSLYKSLLKFTNKKVLRFSDNPQESFPQLKIKRQRLFKFNPDSRGRDRVFYYLQKKPKFAQKSNKPFRLLRINTPRINLSSNLLAVHGVNRHIVERNSKRSTSRVARKRKYYLHHVWRKKFNCSSTTLFYKWKCINTTKRKWLSYFLEFENSLVNYIWFIKLINKKKRAEAAVVSGLVYVNGNACFNTKYSVRSGDVVSLNNEAYNVLITRWTANYLKKKIAKGASPINIKRRFLVKLIKLLQRDVAFGTNAAVQTAPSRTFLIQQAAKFLSSNPAVSNFRANKTYAPGGAKFTFSDISSADLSGFDVRQVFGNNSSEVDYWKRVITNFYKKVDFSQSHNNAFYYRYKNHVYIKRYPYSPHEWFASVKKRATDVYNPLNIDTWISHKYWR